MKHHVVFVVLLFFFSSSLVGQEAPVFYPADSWGDYHYMNGDYLRAIDFFEKTTKELRLDQQRNFAHAYLLTSQPKKAKTTYTPVANSNEASVQDYYRYADLLMEEQRLAQEYREKAYSLPWSSPSLFENDSLLFKKRFGSSTYRINAVEGNTANNEFGLLFLTEGQESRIFYLSDQENTKEQKRILKRIRSDVPIYNFYEGKMSLDPPTLIAGDALPNSVNTFFQEGPGSYDPGNDRFYFSRSNTRFDKKNTVQLNLYSIQGNAINQDKIALPLPFNVAGYSTLHPSISPDGKRLFFASDRPGGYGGMDLYYVDVENGRFSTPVNLGPDINTEGDEVFPFAYHVDQLMFSSNGREGLGKLDVYLTEHVIEKRWETFLLGKDINTKADDFSFGINAALSLGYFASDREGGKGADDLYAFPFLPEIAGVKDHYRYVPSDTLVIANNGVLKNDLDYLNTKDPLQRLIEKEVLPTVAPKNGAVFLNANGSFLYKNTQPLATKDSFAYRVKTVKGFSDDVWVYLDRAVVDASTLSPEISEAFASIYFKLDKSNILKEYLDRVEKVVAVMRKNPTLEVEVSSYTDCRGSEEYNLSLSQRRTQAIIDYVQARIEKPARIYGKGYGEIGANESGQKDYWLIAGSFSRQQNVKQLMQRLVALGYSPVAFPSNNVTRVVVSQADQIEQLNEIQVDLAQKEISSWITENPCNQLSEEVHQANRRTDFKLIQL
ncbi:MAG: OmpA family protein [Flavobacteriaceae bacterium]